MLTEEEIGQRLRLLRKSAGWTQQELADYLECDQSHVAKMEQGKRRFQTSMIDSLCKLYNVDEDNLLSNPSWIPQYNGIRSFCHIHNWGEEE